MEDLITERESQKENELHATYDEKLRNYEDRSGRSIQLPSRHIVFTSILFFREKDLVRQLSLSQTQLRDLRMSNESNQAKLLDQTQRQGRLHLCIRLSENV